MSKELKKGGRRRKDVATQAPASLLMREGAKTLSFPAQATVAVSPKDRKGRRPFKTIQPLASADNMPASVATQTVASPVKLRSPPRSPPSPPSSPDKPAGFFASRVSAPSPRDLPPPSFKKSSPASPLAFPRPPSFSPAAPFSVSAPSMFAAYQSMSPAPVFAFPSPSCPPTAPTPGFFVPCHVDALRTAAPDSLTDMSRSLKRMLCVS